MTCAQLPTAGPTPLLPLPCPGSLGQYCASFQHQPLQASTDLDKVEKHLQLACDELTRCPGESEVARAYIVKVGTQKW